MRRCTSIVWSTVVWFTACAVLSAQNWPSFRGPSASGVADGKEPTAVTWNASTGENILWKTPLADCGNGSEDCKDYNDWVQAWTSIKG